MASGSLLVTQRTHRLYVRGAELANKLRDKLFPSKENQEKEYSETEQYIVSSAEKSRFLLGEFTKPNDTIFDQTAKADKGKLQITLVPRQIIRDIAKVRMFGNAKYKDPNNWKQVSKERYRDAMCRHMLAYLDDPKGVDEESGLTHLAHLATNVAFLCEMESWEDGKEM